MILENKTLFSVFRLNRFLFIGGYKIQILGSQVFNFQVLSCGFLLCSMIHKEKYVDNAFLKT